MNFLVYFVARSIYYRFSIVTNLCLRDNFEAHAQLISHLLSGMPA